MITLLQQGCFSRDTAAGAEEVMLLPLLLVFLHGTVEPHCKERLGAAIGMDNVKLLFAGPRC